MELSWGLLAVCAGVASVVSFVALPRIGTPAPMILFLRFVAVSGVTAVGSSAMYFIYTAGGGILPLVLGDVAMVLSPALLAVAVAVLDGRRARVTSAAVLAVTLIVAIVTATVPLPASLAVKALALAVTSGACAWACARARIEPYGPLRVIGITTAVFALYCVARVAVGLAAGWDSGLFRAGFSFAPATVLGGVAVIVVGAAVIRLRFAAPSPPSPLVCPAGSAVVVGDWDLASAAYGPERLRGLVTELRAAARDLDPDAVDVPRGAELSIPDALDAVGQHLAAAYRWKPEEVILLVDGAATAAIRTHPVRVWQRRLRRRARV
ncbi:hypothetical protein [Microbacterium testaceum]|uniref:hypothetical protein n=1 Tax=Microbacterium testaceum TaxID=2033 RepID=UPI001057062A|nr:hypothetical protein [Microbacterium testaceum]